MREIKFRVRDTETNKIYQPGEICRFHFNDGLLFAVLLWDGDIILNSEPIEYTGLKDKNGKEIYEGDIISGMKPWSHSRVNYPVRFEEGRFMVIPDSSREVIGNIYENPELLESK